MEETVIASPSEFLNSIKTELDISRTMNHEFLRKFRTTNLTDEQVARFATQWFLTAKDHKEAFPGIILNTLNDDVRFELIEILYDEYGYGNIEKIHSKLLKRFVISLGYSDGEISQIKKLEQVENFGQCVRDIWINGDPIYAFGFHFSLEYLAKDIHITFCDGLNKENRYSSESLEYFNYHKVAEQNHADYSETGFLIYAQDSGNYSTLRKGVRLGIKVLGQMWDDFDEHVFHNLKEAV